MSTEGAKARMLTPAEVAEIYTVSRDKVLDWFYAGTIPAEVAEGKVYRFDQEKVAKALAKRAEQKRRDAMRETTQITATRKPMKLPVL